MSIEIELKFALQPRAIVPVQQKILGYTTQPSHICCLTNDYYDTPHADLRGHDLGLRVRGVAQQYEMTLKGKAEGVAGIQQRVEYNIPLPNHQLDIQRLPKQVWPIEYDPLQLQTKLQIIFSTNFQREAWRISYKKSEIEVALDQGRIQSREQSLPILELELELLKGELSELLEFTSLILSDGMCLSDTSKAARGYALLHSKSVNKPFVKQPLTVIEPVLPTQLVTLLKVWQQFDESLLESHDAAEDVLFLEQLSHVTQDIITQLVKSGYMDASLSLNRLELQLSQLENSLLDRPLLSDYCMTPSYQQLKLQLLQVVVQLKEIGKA